MSNCKAKLVARKVAYKKVNKQTEEVDFTIMEDIDSCAKINTKKFVSTSGTATYSPTTVPDDLLNICESFGCKNTGTLLVTGTEPVNGIFTTISDATEYFAGVMYYYLQLDKGKYTVTTTVSDLLDESQTNADVYTTVVDATSKHFYPITIDFAKEPTSTAGSGWTASTNGTRVNISVARWVDPEALPAEPGEDTPLTVGFSSISFFDEIEDLEGNEAIKLGCLTGIEGEDTIDALEEACLAAQYDDTSASVERTITASTWTPNAIKLNPFIHRGEEDTGFFMQTITHEVEQDPDNPEYGSIHISDAYAEECGYIYVSMEDACNITDSVMDRINNPNLMDLNEVQFQVINTMQNPDINIVGSKLYFNKVNIGKTVLISYPKEAAEVESYDFTDAYVNDRRVKMTYTKHITDGVIEVYRYNNVLVTSFPMMINASDSELEYTVKVVKDEKGRYYTMQRINGEGNKL